MILANRFCLLLAACFSFTAFAAEPILRNGVVVRMADGDTFRFRPDDTSDIPRDRLKSGELPVRMIGIDAPEINHGGHLPGQGHHGDDATRALEQMVTPGTRAVLQDYGTDHYKRTLGRLILNGRDINLAMVEGGWAIPYVICDEQTCDKDFFEEQRVADYLQVCAKSQKAGRGVFNPADPLEEMPFEYRLHQENRKPDKFVGDFRNKELHEPADYAAVPICERVFFMKKGLAERVGYTPRTN